MIPGYRNRRTAVGGAVAAGRGPAGAEVVGVDVVKAAVRIADPGGGRRELTIRASLLLLLSAPVGLITRCAAPWHRYLTPRRLGLPREGPRVRISLPPPCYALASFEWQAALPAGSEASGELDRTGFRPLLPFDYADKDPLPFAESDNSRPLQRGGRFARRKLSLSVPARGRQRRLEEESTL